MSQAGVLGLLYIYIYIYIAKNVALAQLFFLSQESPIKKKQKKKALPGPSLPLDSHPDNVKKFCQRWMAKDSSPLSVSIHIKKSSVEQKGFVLV